MAMVCSVPMPKTKPAKPAKSPTSHNSTTPPPTLPTLPTAPDRCGPEMPTVISALPLGGHVQ